MTKIHHPSNSNLSIEYSSIIGPENAVFYRGHCKNKNIISLTEHWKGLIEESSITVQITPFGSDQNIFVKSSSQHQITLGSKGPYPINCYFIVMATRLDVPKL